MIGSMITGSDRPHFPLRSAFLAIPLHGEALARFTHLQKSLADVEGLALQHPMTPHLTLYFWPELMEIEWNPICDKVAAIAGNTEAFLLRIIGLDTFSSRGRDAVLFFSVEFSEPLARLKKKCPWPERRSFHPHITIARVRHPERFSRFREKVLRRNIAPFSLHVDRLTLYGVVGGVAQTPITTFTLRSPQIRSVP